MLHDVSPCMPYTTSTSSNAARSMESCELTHPFLIMNRGLKGPMQAEACRRGHGGRMAGLGQQRVAMRTVPLPPSQPTSPQTASVKVMLANLLLLLLMSAPLSHIVTTWEPRKNGDTLHCTVDTATIATTKMKTTKLSGFGGCKSCRRMKQQHGKHWSLPKDW
jgi:hypothetical protein